MDSKELYDLLILVDATYSMSDYIRSLQLSLPQIISISALTDCFSRIGLLAYRDYCDTNLLDWSGWLTAQSNGEEVDLIKMAKVLTPLGGGDRPEATKTGLARAYQLMREEATTIFLLYTDAPPHTFANGELGNRSSNLGPEQDALIEATELYGGYGPMFADWVSSAKMLSMCSGHKKAQVFSVLDQGVDFYTAGYYNYLSTMTGGACIYLNDSKPASISKVTVELLLAWMGAEKPGINASVELPAFFTKYTSIDNIEKVQSEKDDEGSIFFRTPSPKKPHKSNITKVRLSSDTLKRDIPKKTTPVDFAKRYKVDEQYKKIAADHLRKIIEENVTVISLNPVFGSLWRAVCNDRGSEVREELITTFGLQVDRISNAGDKAHMKIWLEESFDCTAEISELVESVPAEQRFPCVFLDPTLTFTLETGGNEI